MRVGAVSTREHTVDKDVPPTDDAWVCPYPDCSVLECRTHVLLGCPRSMSARRRWIRRVLKLLDEAADDATAFAATAKARILSCMSPEGITTDDPTVYTAMTTFVLGGKAPPPAPFPGTAFASDPTARCSTAAAHRLASRILRTLPYFVLDVMSATDTHPKRA
jgi:hypothetical protein